MTKLARFFMAAVFALGVLVCSASAQDQMGPIVIHRINERGADRLEKPGRGIDGMATGKALTTGSTSAATPNLTYHNGTLLTTPTVYLIWYGNWNQSNGSDNPAGQQIVRDFCNTIGGSPYFQLNSTLSAGSLNITGAVTFGGEATDTGSQGTRLSDNRVFAVVTRALTNHLLPYNANGVYFVLTSSNISETSGFCTQYCGWHTVGGSSFGNVHFAYVGNANRCLNACSAQTTSPNGNAGVDGMVSVIAHELSEATTDPELNAWFDSNGAENGDKCAWTFGHAQFQVSNGSFANITLGSRNFLIQRMILRQSSGTDFCMMNSTQN
ncbi:MAG TPA: hypothetical protein VEZ90_17025 [Blastocatellia bacterium]|nr:hypothetical protein [Blastocatellia bacterium]